MTWETFFKWATIAQFTFSTAITIVMYYRFLFVLKKKQDKLGVEKENVIESDREVMKCLTTFWLAVVATSITSIYFMPIVDHSMPPVNDWIIWVWRTTVFGFYFLGNLTAITVNKVVNKGYSLRKDPAFILQQYEKYKAEMEKS